VQQARRPASHRTTGGAAELHPQRFIFCDRRTGTRRFEVPAGKDGSLPIDQAANLLAIQCVARQQDPKDFSVMVAVQEDLVGNLLERAMHLIRSCAESRFPVTLSRRQHEVLNAVAQNLSNKEIAGKLNVSVRTIKFHVSALLEKFEVRGRVDLMLEATEILSADAVHRRKTAREQTPGFAGALVPSIVGSNGRPKSPVVLDRRLAGR
jgi:DNA-binding CsgD family transcriptional regulator